MVADENSFEDIRAHGLGLRRDSGTVHWLPHYESAQDALAREAYDVAVLDSRHHGHALLRAMAQAGTCTPAVVLVDIESSQPDAAGVTCAFLARNTIAAGRLQQTILKVVDGAATARVATHSPTWWRSGGLTISHSADFPTPPEADGNFFVDATALERHEQLLTGMLRHFPVVVGRLDAAGRIRQIDGGGLMGHGLGPRQMHGTPFLALFPEGRSALERARAGETARFEACLNTGTTDTRHVAFNLGRDDENGTGVVFLGQEVTAHQGLEGQLIRAVDAERHRLGADLHDEVGQILTGITCLSAVLARQLRGRDGLAAENATTIAAAAKEALAQIRALAHGLAPVHLARQGLSGTLEELRIQVRRMHDVDVCLQLPVGRNGFDAATTAHLFRIAQEAIANAIRHGQATKIDISLCGVGGQHCFAIADNGRGFDPKTLPKAAGAGLGLMEYRAALIQGRLTVSSNRPSGTRIEVLFTALDT